MARGGGHKRDEPSAPRAQPHNLQAEESLLGAALLSADALEVLVTRTQPEDFYRPTHGHIAAALCHAYEQGWKADAVTIADELERGGLLEQVGGLGALMSLQVSTPATSSAPRYAEIVHDHATSRRLIGVAGEIAELGYQPTTDVHAAVARAQEHVADVVAGNGSRTYSSLHIPDLGPYVTGTVQLEQPTLLTRTDGQSLFYAGKMHVLQALPSSGKSWIALAAVVEVLALDGAAVYIDYEDTEGGIVSRLLALGAEPEAIISRFRYIRPDGPFGLQEKVELKSILDRLNPDLVIIDGVAEALARDGYDEDRNADVVQWTEKYPRWLARTGAAVVMLDHVAKDPEKRGRTARGAGHKLAAVDGASYEVIISTSFSRHRPGKVLLKIAKERPGGVGAIGEIAAVVHVEPAADGTIVRMRFEPPTAGISEADPWKPTHIMEKISRELEQSATPLTAAGIKGVVQAKKGLVSQAITRLVAEGFLDEVRHGGRAVHLRSVRPYRAPANEPAGGQDQDDDYDEPEERLTDEQLFDDMPPGGPE